MLADEPGRVQLKDIAASCAVFAVADNRRAIFQLVTTLTLLFALVAAMFASVHEALWLTLLLAVPAAGLVVRVFIFQHDCGHSSFFRTRAANDICGRVLSVLTLTPYGLWRREHSLHHASCGNLERRGIGDINTLTTTEYKSLSFLGRLRYRIYRNPLFLFGVGLPLYFLALQRSPWLHGLPPRDSWKSVLALNIALLAVYGTLAAILGLSEVIVVALPIVFIASAAGGWLFFIQHQFEETYWEHYDDWNFQAAAVFGSSYYALPPIINWFTGNIGLHHIHHLNSRIPNYRLQACLDTIPAFNSINRITLLQSLRCVRLKLWDEQQRRLVGFAEIA